MVALSLGGLPRQSPAQDFRRLRSDRQRGAIAPALTNLSRPVAGQRCRSFNRLLRGERKLNMSRYDLYFLLGAALLAFVYECIQQFYRQKPPVVEPRHSNGKEVDPPSSKEVDPPSPLKYLKEAPPLDGHPASTQPLGGPLRRRRRDGRRGGSIRRVPARE